MHDGNNVADESNIAGIIVHSEKNGQKEPAVVTVSVVFVCLLSNLCIFAILDQ